MGEFIVKEPGLLTTIQDQGRWGYQQYGVAVAGAMDQVSMEIANLLVGNNPSEGLIEMTLLGACFTTTDDCLVAITGADMDPKIDGKNVSMYRTLLLKEGQVLSFGSARAGVRSYLALAGGFNLVEVLGSKSTYLRGRIGGLEGRRIERGDRIGFFDFKDLGLVYELSDKFIDRPVNQAVVRVVLGPQEYAFTQEGINTFLLEEYRLTKDIDRMGYRLEGPKISSKKGSDIISDGIAFGSIQVTGDGQPTILMADHQTTGGYAKIATVITPDLSILAQMGQGAKLKFKEISPNQAQEVYKLWRRRLNNIHKNFTRVKEGIDYKYAKDLINSFSTTDLNRMYIDMGEFTIEMEK